MFAEPIYSAAYELGVAATAAFLRTPPSDDGTPFELSRAEADRLVADSFPGHEMISRRLATLVIVGARNEWRRRTTEVRRQSGIREKAAAISDAKSSAGKR